MPTTSRYPGITPFQPEQAHVFFGREQDTERVLAMIRQHQQVLLYGKSGLGKSSLINAGLVPALREEASGKEQLCYVPVRFGNFAEGKALEGEGLRISTSPVATVIDTIKRVAKEMGLTLDTDFLQQCFPSSDIRLWRQYRDNAPIVTAKGTYIREEESIWYYLKALQLSANCRIFLVFDQLEELFTYPEADVLRFKQQLSESLYWDVPPTFSRYLDMREEEVAGYISNDDWAKLYLRMKIKVLYSIREDKYSLLNKLSDKLPDIMQRRYNLAPLTREQAQQAIVLPAKIEGLFRSLPFTYTPDAIEDMLNKLTKNGAPVESTQLQIVCNSIEQDNIAQQRTVVHKNNVPNFDDIFSKYYTDSLAKIPEHLRKNVQQFIEGELVDNGQRLSFDERRLPAFWRENPVIERVLKQEQHLLRSEPNTTGGHSYEIAHDTLVVAIERAKDKRETEEKAAEMRKQIAEQRKRMAFLVLVAAVALGVAGWAVWMWQELEENKIQLNNTLSFAEFQRLEAETKEKQLRKAIAIIQENANETISKKIKSKIEYWKNEEKLNNFNTLDKKKALSEMDKLATSMDTIPQTVWTKDSINAIKKQIDSLRATL